MASVRFRGRAAQQVGQITPNLPRRVGQRSKLCLDVVFGLPLIPHGVHYLNTAEALDAALRSQPCTFRTSFRAGNKSATLGSGSDSRRGIGAAEVGR